MTPSSLNAQNNPPATNTIARVVDYLWVRIILGICIGLPVSYIGIHFIPLGLIIGIGGTMVGVGGDVPMLGALSLLSTAAIVGGWLRITHRSTAMSMSVLRITRFCLMCGVIAGVGLMAVVVMYSEASAFLALFFPLTIGSLVLLLGTPAPREPNPEEPFLM